MPPPAARGRGRGRGGAGASASASSFPLPLLVVAVAVAAAGSARPCLAFSCPPSPRRTSLPLPSPLPAAGGRLAPASSSGASPSRFGRSEHQQQQQHRLPQRGGRPPPRLGAPPPCGAPAERLRRGLGQKARRLVLLLLAARPGGVVAAAAALAKKIRRAALALALAALVALAAALPSLAAVTAGRAGGGSFGPSSASRTSSSAPSSSHHRHYGGGGTSRTRVFHSNLLAPQIRVYSAPSPPNILVIQRQRQPALAAGDGGVAVRWSPGDALLLVGAGSLITYGFANNHRIGRRGGPLGGGRDGALGPGATASHLVAVFRLDPRGPSRRLLRNVRELAERSDTTTRRGVQDLVSDVCLELLRHVEPCLVSAHADSSHYPTPSRAEREYQRRSVRDRAKFDGEAVNRFGAKAATAAEEAGRAGGTDGGEKGQVSTPVGGQLALVSLNVAIEGDSTALPAVRDRDDVRRALETLAADAKVGDCLLSAEVLWAPEHDGGDGGGRGDEQEGDGSDLTLEGLAADYPELVPV